MRVVAGLAKGHKLLCGQENSIRPTSDRVKEAIFSALGHKLHKCKFLDLFSGSGAIGIEAMSRGSDLTCFVESQLDHVQILENNINHVIKAMPSSKYRVIQKIALEAIETLKNENVSFDIIFLDPPYNEDLYENTLFSISQSNILNPGAIVVIETMKHYIPPTMGYFNIIKTKQYGRTAVYYIEPVRSNIK